jgi:hypothetical protein
VSAERPGAISSRGSDIAAVLLGFTSGLTDSPIFLSGACPLEDALVVARQLDSGCQLPGGVIQNGRGNQSSSIVEGALGFFAHDNFRWRPHLTLELGLRYDWNMTPTEHYGRFIVFDPASSSLVPLGIPRDWIPSCYRAMDADV